jgi:thymidylate kinase
MFDCLSESSWYSTPPARPSRVFYFEGNVAVGKTECMHAVAELFREKGVTVKCIEENVERWRRDGLLERHYAGDEAAFVAHALLLDYLRRHALVQEALKTHAVVFVERHPTTSCRVFGFDSKSRALFDAVGTAIPGFASPVPAYTVYVKNPYRICHERSKRRARPEERDLTLAMFERWSTLHDDMMAHRKAQGGKVYEIDAFGADAHRPTLSIVAEMGYA